MEVSPVKEAKQPKYPRMDEVSPESIKEALPRRWALNRAAKAALAALTASALAGCAPDTALPKGYIDPGVPEPPVIPYCIAIGFALSIGIWACFKFRKRKKPAEGEGNDETAEGKAEQEYDGGEY